MFANYDLCHTTFGERAQLRRKLWGRDDSQILEITNLGEGMVHNHLLIFKTAYLIPLFLPFCDRQKLVII